MTEIVPQSHKKLLSEMTLHELREEEAYWTQELEQSDGWGAAVGAAHSFLQSTKRWIARREMEQENEK